MPTITVVVPVRDDAPMLRTLLTALAQQTRPADEILIVDNGSTDDSAEIARRARAHVVHEPIPGIPRATARGFDVARGDILARLDADSVPPADWLARIESAFERDPGLTAVTGPGAFYDAPALIRTFGSAVYMPGYFRSMGLALGHPPLFGSNFAIRADAWRRIGRRVHRVVRTIHDDLDISFQLEPRMRVRYDADLVVGISARPLRSPRALFRRFDWAFHTLAINWRRERPGRRLLRRYLAAGYSDAAAEQSQLRRAGQRLATRLVWGPTAVVARRAVRSLRARTDSVPDDREVAPARARRSRLSPEDEGS